MSYRSCRADPSNRGQTLTQVVVALAVIGMAVVLTIAAATPQGDRAAKIARCANNLRLLAAADHCYADDFGGKFFYDWSWSVLIGGKDAGEPKRWWDRERVGRYVQGTELRWSFLSVYEDPRTGKVVDPYAHFVNDAGLGEGVFACPADRGDARDSDAVAVRSYHQNFWASGVDVPPDAPRDKLRHGEFFDRNSDAPQANLILLGESLSWWGVRRHGDQHAVWSTGGEFGAMHTALARFEGVEPFFHRDKGYRNPCEYGDGRWPRYTWPVQIDYTRHGGDRLQAPTKGGANFAFGDGHVAWLSDTDLVSPVTGNLTQKAIWSPDDLPGF